MIGFINGQSTLSFEVHAVLLLVPEQPSDSFICSPGRTHNRIRSPRLVASGQQYKVGKGSRQHRSVTLGNGLALTVGYMGSLF